MQLKHPKHALSAAVLGFALVLTGCGSTDGAPGSTSSSSTFDKADVEFAQQMIPHHRQAVEMAKLASSRASNPAITSLASDIEAAQGPEIATMTGWLKGWKQKVPSGTPAKGHGDMTSMPGMMSETDLASLKEATGPAFDKQFLTMMISHHRGAIEMAKSEQVNGKNTSARDLAKRIEAAQTREVGTMQGILKH